MVAALGWLHWEAAWPEALRELWRVTGAALFFDLRLRESGEDTVAQQRLALTGAWDEHTIVPYVVAAWPRVARALLALEPARILAHGYWGSPADTVMGVNDEVCFATFVLERGDGPGAGRPRHAARLARRAGWRRRVARPLGGRGGARMSTVAALLLGRGGSTGLPGKNTRPILGRPLMAYPLLAAQASRHISRIYCSTDSDEIRDIAHAHGAEHIERPPELCTPEALGEDAFKHGYEVIRDRLVEEGEELEMLVLLFANAATISGELIDQGVETLRADPSMDSAVTVSQYNMWSPLRARKLEDDGTLQPFVPFETFGDPATLNCDRDSQGDVLFADMGVSIVRPHCLEHMEEGLLPQKWMGQRIAPIPSWGGLRRRLRVADPARGVLAARPRLRGAVRR